MPLNEIDLNLLVVFDTVYTEGGLTRAAEVLGVTQPAISNALARLRESLGDPLFVRSGRTMVPTPAAQNIIGPVRQALTLLEKAVQHPSDFDPQRGEKLYRLSVGEIAESALLPNLVESVRARAPNLRLQMLEMPRRHIARELAAGRIDFAIELPFVATPQLNHLKLFEDRYVCALRPGHPASQGKLTLERYLSLDHALVSSRPEGTNFVDIELNKMGKRRRIVLRSQHYHPAIALAAESDLAVSIPYSLARQHDVAVAEIPFPVPPLIYHLFWHRSAEDDPASQWMRQILGGPISTQITAVNELV